MKIAASGSVHSGKTTTINTIKKTFPVCKIHDELIRDINIGSIDEIRKNADKYFDLQKHVITQKIKQEKEEYPQDLLVLYDRSLIDSYYYLTTYVDPKKLTKPEEFYAFRSYLREEIDNSLINRYDRIYIFKPIPYHSNDPYRPKNLNYESQLAEYQEIRDLTSSWLLVLNCFDKLKVLDPLKEDVCKIITDDFFNDIGLAENNSASLQENSQIAV